jgi:hypothetical protein
MDLEAPGLHYKLIPDKPIEVKSRGIVGMLADVSRGVPAAEINFDIATNVTHLVSAELPTDPELSPTEGQLWIVPAGDPIESDYWLDLAAIDWTNLFVTEPRNGVAAMARLRSYLTERIDPEVMVIDSRTGITPSGGVATTLLPDYVVMMLLDRREHLDGSRKVIDTLTDSEQLGREAPVVLPVLSRYAPPQPTEEGPVTRATRGARLQTRAQAARRGAEEALVSQIWESLCEGLGTDAKNRVLKPVVLHSDSSLASQERLWFGPSSPSGIRVAPGGLLDDYLRLFGSVVPRELVVNHLSGLRSRIRKQVLDRPDDSLRTLEYLATLVGDEEVFVDLAKMYALRRDWTAMLQAADRLFQVHGRIVHQAEVSRVLKNVLEGRLRTSPEVTLSPAFVEAYWKSSEPADPEIGIGAIRLWSDSGDAVQARQLTQELLTTDESAELLTRLIKSLAGGNDFSERLAGEIALENFDSGAPSGDFVRAAAVACRYAPSNDLATRILESPFSASLSADLLIEALRAAGRDQEAADQLIDALSSVDASDSPEDLESLVSAWESLGSRFRSIRTEVMSRNPTAVEVMNDLRDRRRRGYSRRP